MKLKRNLIADIIQWDVESWSPILNYWEKEINWNDVKTSLELGAREGGLSLWLALKGKEVICSDLKNTEASAKTLHQKYNVGSMINYQDIDATNIPYENYFDLIIFKSVIGGIGMNNNIGAQKKVFEEIHKALKPGGKLLFAENLAASPIHQFFRKLFNKWGDYWRYISLEEIKGLLQDFLSFKFKTTGVFSTFGRTEKQRSVIARFDKYIANNLLPHKWRYIIYGIAKK